MSRPPSYPSVLLVAALSIVAGFAQSAPGALEKETPIQLIQKDSGYEAFLQLLPKRGMLTLRLSSEEKSETVPIARRLELWRPLLEQAFRDYGRKDQYLLAIGEYPELKARIAAAAACSGKWNLKTGRPNTGWAAETVKDLLSRDHLYPELEVFFDSLGYQVSVNSVESVMICRWREIPTAANTACRPNPPPAAQTPCGASILFRMAGKKASGK